MRPHMRHRIRPQKQNRPHQWWRRFDHFTNETYESENLLALCSPAASAQANACRQRDECQCAERNRPSAVHAAVAIRLWQHVGWLGEPRELVARGIRVHGAKEPTTRRRNVCVVAVAANVLRCNYSSGIRSKATLY